MSIYVVIAHDTDPDFSWLEQDCYDPSLSDYFPVYPSEADMKAGRNAFDPDWYRDPDNHVALEMVAYEDCDHEQCNSAQCARERRVDSLGNIDFLYSNNDWTTGTFCKLSQLDQFPYLRELAEEMGVK